MKSVVLIQKNLDRLYIGIEFFHGFYTFSAIEDLAEFVEDPDRFEAKGYGITANDLRYWRQYREHPQCTAITVHGKRCTLLVPLDKDLRQLRRGVDDMCVIHRKKGTT